MRKYRTRTHMKKLMALVMTAFLALGGVPVEPFAAIVHADNITTWEQLQTALSAGDKVTLTQNIVARDTDVALVVDHSLTLDLAGHTIDRHLDSAKPDGYVIGVTSGTLTLEDSVGGGCITGGYNTGDGGGYNTGNGGGVYASKGTLIMYGGIISGNKTAGNGGGVYAETFDMHAGEICGNTASGDGGGAYVYGTIQMHGGRIDNNTACNGGGVYSTANSFRTEGSVLIYGNKAIPDKDSKGGCGGGICLKDVYSPHYMFTDLMIFNNTAYMGGGIYEDVNGPIFEAGMTPRIYDNNVWEKGEGSNIYGGIMLNEGGIIYESSDSTCPDIKGSIVLQRGRIRANTYENTLVLLFYTSSIDKYSVNAAGDIYNSGGSSGEPLSSEVLKNAAGKWILPVEEVDYLKEGKITKRVYAASFSADQTMIPVETAGTEENGIGSWFYLKNNISYTEGLDLGTAEGTVNFILHSAKGDPYSLNVGSESAPIEDKSCLANENATLNIYREGNISFHNSCEGAPAVNLKNLNIYDGNVEINAAKSAGLKLNDGGRLTLSGGSFKANNLPEDTSITIAAGKYFKDENNNFYSGTLKKEEVAAISGKRIALAGIPRGINITTSANGRVTAGSTQADKDSIVKLSAIPDAGYRLKEYRVTTAGGQQVEVNDGSFTMPDEEVSVSAVFELIPAMAPAITGQPSDLDLTEGYAAGNVLSITAAADNDYTLSYQWFKSADGSNTGSSAIEGATGAEYTVPAGKPAGTVEHYYCKVTATRKDNGLYASADSRAAKVTVKEKHVDPTPTPTPTEKRLKVTLSKTSYTYDGKAKTPTITVSYNGKKLKKSDYTFKWSSGRKNAGTYTVKVTGKSKAYKKLTGSASFTITKAKNPYKLTLKTQSVKVSDLKKKAQTVSITKAIVVKKAQGAVKFKLLSADMGLTYQSGKKAIKVAKNLKKGTYSAIFKVTVAGGKNYSPAEKIVTVKIKVKK